MAIVTAAEYKAWRGITGSDYDTLIGTLADIATRKIERLTGRTAGGFESESSPYTEQVDGTGTQILRVSNDISTITSIKVGKPGAYDTTIEASGYTFRDRSIMRLPHGSGRTYAVDDFGAAVYGGSRDPSWAEGYSNYEVIYTGGSAVGDIDDDLKHAAYVLIDSYMDSRGRDIGKGAEAVGNANATYATPADVLERVMQLVRPWRDPIA